MLTIYSHYFGVGGWSRHAQCFVQALDRKVELALWSETRPRPGDEIPALGRTLPRSCAPTDIALGIGPFELMPRLVGRVKIGWVVWETSRIPPARLTHLRALDEIWTPTDWGRQLLVDNGVDAERVHVVPQGVSSEAFAPPSARPPTPPFRFLSIGKWEERKATDQLVRHFARAFAGRSDVELVLHAWNPMQPRRDLNAEASRLAGALSPTILVGGQPIDEPALRALYRSAHAFVLPTRAEGWGLPILEAMASGLPAIVTDYSAHRAFADEETGWLIPVERMCEVRDPLFFGGGGFGRWADPDGVALERILEAVVAEPAEAARRGQAARQRALAWSWEGAAAIALRRLERWGVVPRVSGVG